MTYRVATCDRWYLIVLPLAGAFIQEDHCKLEWWSDVTGRTVPCGLPDQSRQQ